MTERVGLDDFFSIPSREAPELPARVVRVADVESERVRWLWPSRVPRGKLTILDGDPGLGKSTALLDLAARLSTGSPLPDGAALEAPGEVVILSAEDGIADTIRPRLEAAGADPSRVHVLAAVRDDEEGGERPPEIPLDLSLVERVVRERRAELVIVDPLVAFLSGSVDSHRDQDVRRALHALAAVADRTGAAIIAVRHLTKTTGPRAVYRGGGSIGIIGAARAALLVAEDPQDESRRVLAVIKSNLAAKPDALAFRLIPDTLRDVPRIEWLGVATYDADDLVGPRLDAEERSALDEACDFLRRELAAEPRPVAEVKGAARRLGIAERTLDRAKKRLGIVAERIGGLAGEGRWTWALPKNAKPDDGGDPGELGAVSGDGLVERNLSDAPRGSSPKSANGELGALSTSLPGDEGFRDFLSLAYAGGHITHRERHERRLLHDRVVRARLLREAAA